MRNYRFISMLMIGLTMALAAISAQAQQYKEVLRLGTSEAVCPGGIESAGQLQEFFANNPAGVRQILADAGGSVNPQALISAIEQGQFTESIYPVGTQMEWMGAKVKGQYTAKPYRMWAGKQSFEAFQVMVEDNCQVYEIAIPKDCCNISLISMQSSTSEQCMPKVAAEVVEEVVPVAQASNKAVPFIGIFAGSEVRPRYEPAWDMHMRDSSGTVGLRAGVLKPMSEKTSFVGQVSYYTRDGVNGGNVFPKNDLTIDVGLERKLSERAFIGAGFGLSTLNHSDFHEESLFGVVGGNFGKSNFQWFLEGRLFDSEIEGMKSASDNRMFSAGVRMLIK